MKKILFILLSVLLLDSCSDFIDRKPENAVTFNNYFRTETEVQTAVESMQNVFRSCFGSVSARLYRHRALPFDYLADYWDNLTYNNFRDTYTPYSPVLYWENEYRVIAMAHMIVDNIHRAKLEKERHDFYLGQAYFVLAYTYFKLIQYWGDVPFVEHMEDISTKPRTSWLIIWDYVIEYGKQAAGLLPPDGQRKDVDGNTIIDKQIPSSGSAWALLAYAYGWRAQLNNQPELLPQAIHACDSVIYSGDYELAANITEVTQTVMLGDSREAIFELNYSKKPGEENPNGDCLASMCQVYPLEYNSTPATPRYDMAIKFTTVFSMYPEETDNRRMWFYNLKETSELPYSQTQGYAYPYKFPFPLRYESGFPINRIRAYENNECLIRLAGIYLLSAEYKAKTGDYAGAIADLNIIKRRAGCKDYSGSNEDLRREISRERNRELFCEGDRFLDLVREGFVEDLPGFKNIIRKDIEDGRLFIPLSRMAFDNNTLMTQYPYWKNQGY